MITQVQLDFYHVIDSTQMMSYTMGSIDCVLVQGFEAIKNKK